MAWTAPLTWTPDSVLTAAQLNVHLRDNLLETEAAKATGTGGYFASTGVNAIAERQQAKAEVTTSETTASTTFVNLATTGPAVTVTNSEAGSIMIFFSAQYQNNTADAFAITSPNITGANTIAPSDTYAVASDSNANYIRQHMHELHLDSLTGGVTTITLQYRVTSGTGTFSMRRIVAFPF